MSRKFFLVTLVLSLAFVGWACGGKSGEEKKAEAVTKSQPAQPEAAVQPEDPEAAAVKAEGAAVAKEILDTFDKAVAEAAELAKDKPAAAELKPRLEALIERYKKPMTDLNLRFLALRDKDVRAFGAANGYMGENRGRHVFNMYNENALGPAIAYYNIEKNEQEIVELLTKKIIELINIAVKM